MTHDEICAALAQHQALLVSIARRFEASSHTSTSGLDLDDLVTIAWLGAHHSLRRYRGTGRVQPWVWRGATAALIDASTRPLVSFPGRALKALYTARRRAGTAAATAEDALLLAGAATPAGLDRPVMEGSDDVLGDLLPAPSPEEPDPETEARHAALEAVLDAMSAVARTSVLATAPGALAAVARRLAPAVRAALAGAPAPPPWRPQRRPRRPVRDAEAGTTWPTVSAAAAAIGVTPAAVSAAIGRGRRCCGRLFAYVDSLRVPLAIVPT